MVGVLGAVAVAVAVLAVAWSLDRSDGRQVRDRVDPSTITDLVAPDPLSDRERASIDGTGGAGVLARPTSVALTEGGWIEVADDEGRLRQRYAADRMDPRPDGWVDMVEPRAVVFGRTGQVTTLEG
ncbi:MAG: hypothetical protein ACYTFH_03675, partial [Planctomycetota bacterium]